MQPHHQPLDVQCYLERRAPTKPGVRVGSEVDRFQFVGLGYVKVLVLLPPPSSGVSATRPDMPARPPPGVSSSPPRAAEAKALLGVLGSEVWERARAGTRCSGPGSWS
mmetsp:Transcript_47915/g.138642  ORF Transcript_47915/g.138642 Transcript_47915/m.138642 type:complete len:108 (+) Transcript_47915:92-415(+)